MNIENFINILKHCRTVTLVMFMFLGSISLLAQSSISGKVIDELGEPITGVSVVEKGTNNGITTDYDGNYKISVRDIDKAILEFSFIGYATKDEVVRGRPEIDVRMEIAAINLGEVIAIGYGTQTRREITGSITNISSEDFNKGVSRDATDLLQGKVAGLTITSGSGDVTRGSTMRLRGTSTLQNDQGPLIVIDGIPGGDLSTISPSDIESISVLKDASSAAIYGSRAAGGVILVTSKRGYGSSPEINYNAYVAMDVVANKPDMLNTSQWRDANQTLGNDISSYDRYTANTDWFDEMMRTGISQSHALSMSGGSNRSNYRASYTFLDRKGIARDNFLERHNFLFQFQQRAIDDRLRVNLAGSGTISDMQMPFSNNWILAYNMPPVYPVYNDDGSYFTGANNNYDQGNPIQNQNQNYRTRKNSYFYGTGDVLFDILSTLNAKVTLYKSRFSNESNEWRDPRNQAGQGDNGFAEKSTSFWDRQLMEWTSNFKSDFDSDNKHKFEALVGYSYEENEYTNQKSQVTNFAVHSMGVHNLETGNTLKLGNVTSAKNTYKLISFFARTHYSFSERYMLTATVRRDGSSKFGKNHKWGTFPSASLAWNITQEPFMQETNWLNDLKLRAGYGVTGNQDGLQPYKSLELYSASGTYYNDGSLLTAFKISQNANPDLKWESTSMLNIGVDFSLLGGRLGGTVEVYDKKTSDMLYLYKVPTPTYVYDRMQANVGDMSNKGIELMLTADIVHNKEFSWTSTINLAHNKNKITRLSNDIYTTDRIYAGDPWIRGGSGVTSHVIEEGRPVGQFFMLKSTGLTEDGKYIIEDVNGDGQITDDDRTYVGDAQPKLTFGWNNTFRLKNWDLSIFIRGTLGNKALNNPLAAYGNNTYLSGANALNNDLLFKMSESSRISSFYIEDASFARLDNMAIGYTFNTKNINWLKKARIYAAAQNLFVITKYKGLDPEVELFRGEATDENAGLSPGIEPRDFMPKARTFSMGVNLTF